MKRKQFNDLLMQTLLNNKEFLHNHFEVINGNLWWRKSNSAGKGSGARRVDNPTVQIKGIHVPVSDIISVLEF